MKFKVVTGTPITKVLAPVCEEIVNKTGNALVSGYRGDQAEGLIRRLGKSTQRMLFNGWVARLPGFNPANPPNQSTHECFSDGVPYRGPIGRLLFAWQCGMDWRDAEAALRWAKANGVAMVRPYSDPREAHHTNIMEPPSQWGWKPKPPPLSDGSRGKRVAQLTGWLAYLDYDVEKTGKYDERAVRAVREFQKRHSHLLDDGVAGHMTVAQVKAGVREKKRRRRDVKTSKRTRAQKRTALAKVDRAFAPPRRK